MYVKKIVIIQKKIHTTNDKSTNVKVDSEYERYRNIIRIHLQIYVCMYACMYIPIVSTMIQRFNCGKRPLKIIRKTIIHTNRRQRIHFSYRVIVKCNMHISKKKNIYISPDAKRLEVRAGVVAVISAQRTQLDFA